MLTVVSVLEDGGVSVVLRLDEVGKHVLPAPAVVAVAFPEVKVASVAPHVEHVVDGGTAAQDLAAGPVGPVLDHALAGVLLGFGLVLPVVLGHLESGGEHGNLRLVHLVSARFQQQHLDIGVVA